MKKILTLLLFLAISMSSPQVFAFSVTGNACNSPSASQSSVCQAQNSTGNPISGSNGILAKVINIISIVAGVASVIMMLVAGLEYVTSGGDSNRINTAKNTILFAIIGIVIVAVSQIIIAFITPHL